jgi:hypothetical protein
MKCRDLKLMHVYDVNVGTSFKNINNVKSCTLLDASTLNSEDKKDNIRFI